MKYLLLAVVTVYLFMFSLPVAGENLVIGILMLVVGSFTFTPIIVAAIEKDML